jgi:hypothetical protein
MRLRTVFPATAWLLMGLASKPARRIYICVLAVVLIPAVALRIEAMVFQFRVLKLTSALSTLRIGVTSKNETVSRVPGLRVVRGTSKDYHCGADECFAVTIPNSRLSNWIFVPRSGDEHRTLNSVLRWLGFRYWEVSASVDFSSGRVSDFGYRLILSADPSNYPGALIINVWSRTDVTERLLSWNVDESPNYIVYPGKWPDFQTGVYFTRDAPGELLGHAFDLRLRCLWSLAGCQTADQLLPQAEQDRLGIKRAAIARVTGPDQCPLSILPRRARDAVDILLVEVKTVSEGTAETESGYRIAMMRLLRVLKGKPQRPPATIVVAPEIHLGELSAHNSAFDLLKPGQSLLLFAGYEPFPVDRLYVAAPCEAMDGNAAAVQILERALGPS